MRAVVRGGYHLTIAVWLLSAASASLLDLRQPILILLFEAAWIAAVTGVLLLNIGFLSNLKGESVPRLGAANYISLLRLTLLPLLVALILQGRWIAALVAYVAVSLSDVADGVVARWRREETRLGFVLDPFGDVLFQVAVFVSLYMRSQISGLLLATVLLRYGLLFAGCAVLYLVQGRIWIRPTPFGRSTGVALWVGTVLLLATPRMRWDPTIPFWIERLLTVLFAAGTLHVLSIGWMNFRRPPAEGYGYAKAWGILIRRERPGDEMGDGARRNR
jgi:cardiolipin synthase